MKKTKYKTAKLLEKKILELEGNLMMLNTKGYDMLLMGSSQGSSLLDLKTEFLKDVQADAVITAYKSAVEQSLKEYKKEFKELFDAWYCNLSCPNLRHLH